MRIHCAISLFIPITSALAAPALAAQSLARLPAVIVSGVALPDPNPLDNADVTHIAAENLGRQQAVTLADALRRIPGAYVTQQGGIGQEARVSLRGAGAANTMVVVNGMPVHDAGDGYETVDLSRWSADDIAEIQVIQGPMGSLYGPGGMGGVVAIETKKGEGAHKTVARVEAGSFHTVSQMAGIQGQKGLMDYHVAGSRLQSAGTSRTPERFSSRSQGKPNDPLHQETVTARLGVGRDSANLSFFSRYLARRLGNHPNPVSLPRRINFFESFNRLQGHFENAAGEWKHDVGFGYYQNGLTNIQTTGDQDTVIRNASQVHMDWRQAYDVTDRLRLQAAMDYGQEKLDWGTKLIPRKTFMASHGGLGGTLSWRMYENFMVTGSIRADKYQGIPSPLTYRLGGQYSFEKVTVKGGVGTAFKAPTLQQRFYKSPLLSGNPDLKPEHNFGWDVGVERPFWEDRLTLSLTLFQNRIRDLIASSSDGKSLANMDQSRTQGGEGLARLCLASGWTLEFSHTYTQAWDEKTGKGLIGAPRNKTAFSIVKQVTPAWRVSGNVLYVGPRDTFDAVTFARVKTSSYTIVGAETAYQLTEQWQIYGRGENLLNRSYENPQSARQPGIGLYAGVRAQW